MTLRSETTVEYYFKERLERVNQEQYEENIINKAKEAEEEV